jgi:hypothetical protein
MQKNVHKNSKSTFFFAKNAHKKSSLRNTQTTQKKCPKNAKKFKNSHKKRKKHTKNAKNDISVLTDTSPGRWGRDIVLVRNFHDIGYPRYYRDISESTRPLTFILPVTMLTQSLFFFLTLSNFVATALVASDAACDVLKEAASVFRRNSNSVFSTRSTLADAAASTASVTLVV